MTKWATGERLGHPRMARPSDSYMRQINPTETPHRPAQARSSSRRTPISIPAARSSTARSMPRWSIPAGLGLLLQQGRAREGRHRARRRTPRTCSPPARRSRKRRRASRRSSSPAAPAGRRTSSCSMYPSDLQVGDAYAKAGHEQDPQKVNDPDSPILKSYVDFGALRDSRLLQHRLAQRQVRGFDGGCVQRHGGDGRVSIPTRSTRSTPSPMATAPRSTPPSASPAGRLAAR